MSVWTTPTTRSVGLLVTPAIWNTDIVNNLIYLKTAPVFDTAVIIGAATTAGVRLSLDSGALAIREGDNSTYAPLIASVVNVPSAGSINFASGDVTLTHSTDALAFAGAANGYTFANGPVRPATNDGAALGTTATQWSDLFLASGGVINFANGDVTITHTTDTLTFGGAASGYIFHDGNVGLGVAPGSVKLDILDITAIRTGNSTVNATTKESKYVFRHYTNAEEDAMFAYVYSTSTVNEIYIGGGSSAQNAATQISFVTAASNTTVAGTERMRIPAAGGVQCVTTLSVGNAAPAASGAGVTFPAAQSASSDANTLDDYQEAAWTPTIVGSTTAGTGTYASNRIGRYTKIGNMITLWAYIPWGNHTGTGNIEIGGLPEAVVSLTDYRACGTVITSNIALTAANIAGLETYNGATTLQLVQQPGGGGAVTAVPMDTSGALTITITYMTN